jgi:hypothetical protein
MFFAPFKLMVNNLKGCENQPKSIKTMGYSRCFLAKNDQKYMFFAPFK